MGEVGGAPVQDLTLAHHSCLNFSNFSLKSLLTLCLWPVSRVLFIYIYVLLIFIFNGADGVAILFSSITAFWGKNWRRKWQPTPVLLPGKSHGWRSLVGYSPWGRQESETTERLSDFTFHFHALEKEMATHSSVLTWRIPGTGEPGGLPSMGSHRVGHDWSDLATVTAAGEKLLPFPCPFCWQLLCAVRKKKN